MNTITFHTFPVFSLLPKSQADIKDLFFFLSSGRGKHIEKPVTGLARAELINKLKKTVEIFTKVFI